MYLLEEIHNGIPKMQKRIGAPALALVMLASGCAAVPEEGPGGVGRDPALDELVVAARDISASLQKLATLASVGVPPARSYPTPDSGPLTTPVTLVWDGPAEPIAETVASMIGFSYRTVGKPPLTPVVIQLDVTNEMAFKVFEDLAWQIDRKADLVINPTTREVQLIYKGHQP